MSADEHLLLVIPPPPGTSEGARLIDADPGQPHLSVLDVAATRGDGVFETISVGAGHPQALEAHLDRFARSARMLDLPTPTASCGARRCRRSPPASPTTRRRG